ncbi:MAG: NeuD/PglB/VioB family sugar acetyltransferase [Micropruina sp.]|nr:NeuD/PglB/VioB family sugar acetyltransferase [Micropruina sp.]
MRAADGVVVIGASGFGRESLDVLEALRAHGSGPRLLGVLDDAPSQVNRERLAARGVPLLGSVSDFLASAEEPVAFVVGIGSPALRRDLAERMIAAGHRPFTAVHPSVSLGSQVTLGEGCVLCAGVIVSTNVRLGRQVHLNPGAVIGHDSVLDDYVSVNPGAIISGEVHLSQGTLVGAGAIVLQQLTVAANVVVGAGAVVTKAVPAGVVVKGVPGRWPAQADEGTHG